MNINAPDYKKYIKEILWTEEQIQSKCKELAAWIDKEYANSSNLIVIGLLKGCYPFFADLVKKVTVKLRMDCMRFSSYQNRTTSSGDIRMLMDSSISLKHADVVIIDEIVDTGLTSKKVVKMIKAKGVKSVKMLALLNKKEGRKTNFHPDMYGFESPLKFLVGYGLDFNEHFRQLPYIAVFNEKYIDDPLLQQK